MICGPVRPVFLVAFDDLGSVQVPLACVSGSINETLRLAYPGVARAASSQRDDHVS